MYQLKKEPNGELRSNLICCVCSSPFEFIDDKNGFAIVNRINVSRGQRESMMMDIVAKCPICGYRAKYKCEVKLQQK